MCEGLASPGLGSPQHLVAQALDSPAKCRAVARGHRVEEAEAPTLRMSIAIVPFLAVTERLHIRHAAAFAPIGTSLRS